MKLTHLLAATTLAATLTLPLAAQDVKTDYDHKADFHAYHTFSFHKIHASDPLFESRIHDEIASQLTARGLQMVPSGGDLNIAAIGGMSTQQEYSTFYDGLGGFGFGWRGWRGWGGGWAGPGETTTTVTQIPVGTLVVDLYDHNTHQLVWRGTASDQLSNKADKNTKKLDKAIDKMFDKVPPKSAM
jgi:hypothetical protein